MSAPILLSSSNDLSFMIDGLFSYKLFGQTFWITTSHVCTVIVVLLLVGFALVARIKMKKATEIPTGFQNVVEMIVEKLHDMIIGTMGPRGKGFANYISTIFIFILLSNLSGLIGLRPPTADYGVTLPMGLITFFLIHITQLRNSTLKEVWVDLCDPLPPWLPIWLPINIIGNLAVPLSLSLRLFANILAGLVIMALIYSLLGNLAIAWPGFLNAYFDVFSGAIQTYVFCMLTMTYIKNAMPEEA